MNFYLLQQEKDLTTTMQKRTVFGTQNFFIASRTGKRKVINNHTFGIFKQDKLNVAVELFTGLFVASDTNEQSLIEKIKKYDLSKILDGEKNHSTEKCFIAIAYDFMTERIVCPIHYIYKVTKGDRVYEGHLPTVNFGFVSCEDKFCKFDRLLPKEITDFYNLEYLGFELVLGNYNK